MGAKPKKLTELQIKALEKLQAYGETHKASEGWVYPWAINIGDVANSLLTRGLAERRKRNNEITAAIRINDAGRAALQQAKGVTP